MDIDPNFDNSDLQCFRFEKFQNSHIRPVKVTVKSQQDVLNIIRKATSLNSSDQHKDVRLSFDRTPKQLVLYRQLKQQLEDRIKKGETNLKIRYYNGTPRIVRLN